MGPVLVLYIAFAAISLFACFLQLFISFRKSGELLFLVCSILSFLVFVTFGLLVLCSSVFGESCSPYNLLRYLLILMQAVSVCMLGVLFHILKDNRKVYILINTSIFWLLILISFIVPDNVLFGDNPSIFRLSLSKGDELMMIDPGLTWWRALMDLTILIFAISSFLLLLKRLDNISFRTIVILFAGIGFVVMAALWDQFVDLGQIQKTYMLPFGIFLLYIILIFIPFVVFIKEIFNQQILIEQEKKWRNLINEAEIIVVGLNRMGHVEFVNPYFFELTGYSKGEVMGKDWFEFFIPAADNYKVQGTFVEILAYEFHPHYFNPILTKHKGQKMIRWFNVRNLDAGGKITGSLSVGVDVTEENKEKELVLKKLKEAENLIARLNEKTGKS